MQTWRYPLIGDDLAIGEGERDPCRTTVTTVRLDPSPQARRLRALHYQVRALGSNPVKSHGPHALTFVVAGAAQALVLAWSRPSGAHAQTHRSWLGSTRLPQSTSSCDALPQIEQLHSFSDGLSPLALVGHGHLC